MRKTIAIFLIVLMVFSTLSNACAWVYAELDQNTRDWMETVSVEHIDQLYMMMVATREGLSLGTEYSASTQYDYEDIISSISDAEYQSIKNSVYANLSTAMEVAFGQAWKDTYKATGGGGYFRGGGAASRREYVSSLYPGDPVLDPVVPVESEAIYDRVVDLGTSTSWMSITSSESLSDTPSRSTFTTTGAPTITYYTYGGGHTFKLYTYQSGTARVFYWYLDNVFVNSKNVYKYGTYNIDFYKYYAVIIDPDGQGTVASYGFEGTSMLDPNNSTTYYFDNSALSAYAPLDYHGNEWHGVVSMPAYSDGDYVNPYSDFYKAFSSDENFNLDSTGHLIGSQELFENNPYLLTYPHLGVNYDKLIASNGVTSYTKEDVEDTNYVDLIDPYPIITPSPTVTPLPTPDPSDPPPDPTDTADWGIGTALANMLGSVFTQILSLLVSLITLLINLVTQLFSSIGSFFASAITGVGSLFSMVGDTGVYITAIYTLIPAEIKLFIIGSFSLLIIVAVLRKFG